MTSPNTKYSTLLIVVDAILWYEIVIGSKNEIKFFRYFMFPDIAVHWFRLWHAFDLFSCRLDVPHRTIVLSVEGFQTKPRPWGHITAECRKILFYGRTPKLLHISFNIRLLKMYSWHYQVNKRICVANIMNDDFLNS